jgi:hypothetical protein
VPRTGDGSDAAPFSPNVPEGTYSHGYIAGTKFLIATDSDLAQVATEPTSATAVSLAARLYGITVDHLDYVASDPESFIVACSQIARVALHAPTAFLMSAGGALRAALT